MLTSFTWLHLTMTADNASKLRDSALRILTQREHSAQELQRKLEAKGFAREDITDLINELESQSWLDEARFTEVFVRSRVRQGYGPLHIRQELRQRGVADSTQVLALEVYADSWIDAACQARHKRFGEAAPQDIKQRAKQARFLTYRGFTSEHIRAAFDVSAVK